MKELDLVIPIIYHTFLCEGFCMAYRLKQKIKWVTLCI